MNVAANNYDLSMTVSTGGAESKVTKLGTSATKTGTAFDRSATKSDKAATAYGRVAASATRVAKATAASAKATAASAIQSTKAFFASNKYASGLVRVAGASVSAAKAGLLYAASAAKAGASSAVAASQINLMSGSMGKFLKTASLFVAIGLAASVFTIGKSFETLRTQLETVTGSQGAAQQSFAQILDFAKSTPFEVDNMTASFIRLKAVGIEPTNRLLTASGDIAAANGKGILDFSEAIVGAVTGEMERLKQFGIVAKQQGDEVTFIFKGVEKTVKKNSKEIVSALLEIGETSFSGGMERQSKTLAGRLSNLSDAWSAFADVLFTTGVDDFLKDVASSATRTLNIFSDTTRELGGLAGSFNIIKAGFADIQASAVRFFAKLLAGLAEIEAEVLDFVSSILQSVASLPAGLIPGMPSDEELRSTAQSFALLAQGIRVGAQQSVGDLVDLAGGLDAVADESRAKAIDLSNAALGRLSAAQTAATGPTEGLTGALDKQRQGIEKIVSDYQDLLGFTVRIKKEFLEIAQIELPTGSLGRLPRIDGLGPGARFRQPGDVIETAAGQMTILSRSTERAGVSLSEIGGIAGQVAGSFAGMGNEIGDLLASLSDGLSTFSQVVQQTGSVLAGALAGLQATGIDFGDTGNSILGGAAAGAQIGAQFGVPAWGAAVGAAVGLISDILSTTEQGFANGATHADGVRSNLAEGELASEVEGVVGVIEETFNDILSSLGGTVTSFTEFGVLWRNDSKGLRIAIDGIWTTFGDDIEGALDFAVTELVKRSNIVGLSPEVQSAIQSFTGNTIEGLQEAIALGLRLEAGRIGPEAAAVRDNLRGIFDDIQAGLDAGIDVTGGFADLGRARDELLGVARSQEEIIGSRIDAFNAEIKVQQAQLQVMLAETLARAAQSQVNRGLLQEQISQIDVGSVLVSTLGAVTGQMGHMASVSAASLAVMADATSDAVAAINDALAQLDSLLISDGERAGAIARGGRTGASGGGDGGAAQREREREEFRESMRRVALAISGVSENVLGFLDVLNRLDDEIEGAARSGISPEEIAAARADQLEMIRQNLLDPWQDFVARVGETDFETSFRELWSRAEEAFQNAFNLAVRLADQQGISLEEAYRPLFDLIAEGFNAETMALFADEFERLAAAGDVAGLELLGESLAAMFETLPQGVQEALAEIWPDLFGELEIATEAARENLRASLVETFADLGDGASRGALAVQAYQNAVDEVTNAVEQGALTAEEAAIRFAELGDLAFAFLGDQLNGFLDEYFSEVEGHEEHRLALEQFRFQMELANLNVQFQLLSAMGILSEDVLAQLQALIDFINDPANQPDLDQPPVAPPAPPTPPTSGGGGGGGPTLLEQAQAFLDGLGNLETATITDPIEAVNAQMDALIDQAQGLAGILPALGTSIGEVTSRIEDLRAAKIEELFEQAFSSFDDLLQSLQTGASSGLSGVDQVAAAKAEFENLAARAAGGDLEAAGQLGASGRNLLGLAESVSPSLARSIRSLILSTGTQLGRGGAGGVLGGPVTIGPKDLILSPVKLTPADILRSAGLPSGAAGSNRGTSIFRPAASSSRADGSDVLRASTGGSGVFLDTGTGSRLEANGEKPIVVVVKGDPEANEAVIRELQSLREEVANGNDTAKLSEEARHDDHLDRLELTGLSIQEIRKNRPRATGSKDSPADARLIQ